MDPAAQEAANPPVLHRATHVAERMLLGGSFDERYCAAQGGRQGILSAVIDNGMNPMC